jgi:hypothetical protein
MQAKSWLVPGQSTRLVDIEPTASCGILKIKH